MNVLFLGHYKNNDENSILSQNFILAMHQVGINILCRNIDNTFSINPNINPKILELENEKQKQFDVCIQYLFPEYVVGTARFKKNIGILNTDWLDDNKIDKMSYIYNLLDEVWVLDLSQKKKIEQYITSKINIIPPPTLDLKQKIHFMYNSPHKDIETFSFENVGNTIKEILNA